MKFGSTGVPELVDFTLPPDHPGTEKVLKNIANGKELNVYVGCAKWNKQDLKGFYPRGTKDELTYYSTQFNCIEMNATFYKIPSAKQVFVWSSKTPDGFKFFPKVTSTISHYRRLSSVASLVDEFCTNISAFESKLGMVFLQMHDNFSPGNFETLCRFIKEFPPGIPLALELRNTEWYNNAEISANLFNCMQEYNISSILVDTAGRRDLLHMRLTTPTAFVRYVGANHASDYKRLDDWIGRLEHWIAHGLHNLYFFVHQNIEKESPLLSAYFITRLNERFGLRLKVPEMAIQSRLNM
jgi:uncharacterized protein YecE (DUF72 family)